MVCGGDAESKAWLNDPALTDLNFSNMTMPLCGPLVGRYCLSGTSPQVGWSSYLAKRLSPSTGVCVESQQRLRMTPLGSRKENVHQISALGDSPRPHLEPRIAPKLMKAMALTSWWGSLSEG